MGSYTFKWDEPAEEVYVTGTFDNWTKSVKLDKVGDIFQKTVDLELPRDSTKIQYKFVVDNRWVASNSAPKEVDHEGNDNNVLSLIDLTPTGPAAGILNTVTPVSTTAALAGQQPLEKSSQENEPQPTPSDVPGGFPITPANELDQPIGVNPLPAAAGAVNPITLAPGEAIPETISAQGLNDNVKLDKESYEKSDALAGVDTQLPPVTSNLIPESSLPMGTGATDATINTVGAGATTAALAGAVPLESKVPEVVKESQEKASVEPEASAVPAEVEEKAQVEDELKAKVPEVPATSEGIAGVGTQKSENSGDVLGAAAAAVTAAGATALGAAILAKDTVAEKAAPLVDQASTTVAGAAGNNLPDSFKQELPASVQETLAAHTQEQVPAEVSPAVPAEVKESIAVAGESPEAAANTEAVEEKKAVEAELLKEVAPAPAAADEVKPETVAAQVPSEVKESIVAAGQSPEAATNPEAVAEKSAVESELLKEVAPVPAADETKAKIDEPKPADVVASVPSAVKESLVEADKSPEAAANAGAVEDKKAVESELLKEVQPVPAATETKVEEPLAAPALAEPKIEAPKTEAAKTEAPKTELPKTELPKTELPKTETPKTEAPKADSTPANGATTSANGSNGASSKPAEPAASGSSKPTDTASTTTDKKKKNRLSSLFSKIKHKLSDKP